MFDAQVCLNTASLNSGCDKMVRWSRRSQRRRSTSTSTLRSCSPIPWWMQRVGPFVMLLWFVEDITFLDLLLNNVYDSISSGRVPSRMQQNCSRENRANFFSCPGNSPFPKNYLEYWTVPCSRTKNIFAMMWEMILINSWIKLHMTLSFSQRPFIPISLPLWRTWQSPTAGRRFSNVRSTTSGITRSVLSIAE